jgi:Virulence factor
MPAELTVIRWRDIPAQVIAASGRTKARIQLADRFQEAIDVAATKEGLIGTDEYLAEWRKDTRACGEDLEGEARAEAERLDRAFPPDVLDGLARTGGLRGR